MSTVQTLFIRGKHLPACINCKHFQKTILGAFTGKCTLFGEKDVVTDEIKYKDARDCRLDEEKCGLDAIHFKNSDLIK